MATTRKYDNGPNGWTDYDEKGNAVGAGVYNAPGTERNPFNADISSNSINKGVNSGYTSNSVSASSGNTSSMKDAMDGQLKAQTSLYDQQAAAQAAKIRQALETQTQLANNTKQDYTNQMNSAITTLNTERAKIPGQTATLNNTASSTGMTNAQKIRNSLAQMGLLQSGESASQQLLNDTTVQNNINANDLQGQELDMGYGNQIASAQTDLASKVKQINDAISLAQRQGDENSLLVLQDAQAKIANAAATSAVDYNKYAYTAGRDATSDRMTQQQIDATNIQKALDNVYRQNQADLAAKQWQSQFDQGNTQFNQNYALQQQQLAQETAYKNAALARSGSSGGGLSVTELNYLDKMDTNTANNKAFSILNELANDGKTRSDILTYLNRNFSKMEGADYDDLLARAQKAFTWDKDSEGNWYNTWVDKTPQ